MPRRLLAFTLLTIAIPPAVAAELKEPHWQVTLSSYLFADDYGTDTTSRFAYAPLGLRWMSRKGDVTVTVPYLDVTNASAVLVFRGVPQPSAPQRPATPTRPGATPTRATPTPTPVAEQHTTRHKGLGDVAVMGRYFLSEGRGAWPMIDLMARVELPTGDESEGLGLGAASTELGIQLSKPMGRRFVGLADASYTFVGKPEAFEVRNTWEYSMGVGFYPTPALLVSLSFEEWRPVSKGVANGRDLAATAALKATRALRLFASAQLPLSEAAPGFTAGAGLGVRF